MISNGGCLRLCLKVFQQQDLDAAKQFWGDAEVMEHSGGATPHELLPKVLQGYEKCYREKGLSVYAVTDKSFGKVIGAAGFNVNASIDKVELIYHFSKLSWGKGFATEAAKACIDIAKQHHLVKTLNASADPLNLGSTKILENIGFHFIEMRWFEDTQQNEPYYEYPIR